MDLNQIIPNLNVGLTGVGFLFGAGTSLIAGFPLSKGLTIKVIGNLNEIHRNKLIEQFEEEKIEYDFSKGRPDIEFIFSKVSEYKLRLRDTIYNELESALLKGILDVIRNNKSPNLSYHINFLKAIKRLVGSNNLRIFIFTTNWDLSFEMAAKYSKIPIYNGFMGTLYRYFDVSSYKLRRGNIINSNKFKELNGPVIILIKLHGSISWYKENMNVYESSECIFKEDKDKVIILPREEKVMDTLGKPFDQIFSYCNNILGSAGCRYLISCGYSFRDFHINERLLEPKLKSNKIKLTSLFQDISESAELFKQYPSFQFITEEQNNINGSIENIPSDIWKFSRFVEEFKKKVGL